MTRKDYILIAEVLRNQLVDATARHQAASEAANRTWLSGTQNGIIEAVESFADSLARDNARFNREHFLAVVRGEKDLNSRPARS